MSAIDSLANTIATAIQITKNTKGMAQYGVYSSGFVTVESGTLPAVKAVPINLYDGKQVWVQVTSDNTAVIIGD